MVGNVESTFRNLGRADGEAENEQSVLGEPRHLHRPHGGARGGFRTEDSRLEDFELAADCADYTDQSVQSAALVFLAVKVFQEHICGGRKQLVLPVDDANGQQQSA